MDRFNIAEQEMPLLNTGIAADDALFDELSDEQIAAEMATLFSGDLEIDDIFSDDLDFLDDEY